MLSGETGLASAHRKLRISTLGSDTDEKHARSEISCEFFLQILEEQFVSLSLFEWDWINEVPCRASSIAQRFLHPPVFDC